MHKNFPSVQKLLPEGAYLALEGLQEQALAALAGLEALTERQQSKPSADTELLAQSRKKLEQNAEWVRKISCLMVIYGKSPLQITPDFLDRYLT